MHGVKRLEMKTMSFRRKNEIDDIVKKIEELLAQNPDGMSMSSIRGELDFMGINLHALFLSGFLHGLTYSGKINVTVFPNFYLFRKGDGEG